MTDEINELKEAINQLTVQLSVVSTKHLIVQDMLLGILSEKMPEDYPNIYSNFVDRYEQRLNESLDGLHDMLFDIGDSAFILHEKMKLFEVVQAMKRDKDYRN